MPLMPINDRGAEQMTWDEDVTFSEDYDSPRTAIDNALNRNMGMCEVDGGRQHELVSHILDTIHRHGYKIIRDVSRPELFDDSGELGFPKPSA